MHRRRHQFQAGTNRKIPYSRYLWHISLSGLVFFWSFYSLENSEWSWKLNTALPAAILLRILYKGWILKDPNDVEVQILSVSSSPSDLLFGPLQAAGSMIYLGLYHFCTTQSAVIAAALVGDALAPLVGTRYGRHVYQLNPLARTKTMEGSIVVFLTTVFMSYVFLHAMDISPVEPLRMVLAYGAIAAVAEATAPSHLDNLVICMVLLASIPHVQTLLDDDAFGTVPVVVEQVAQRPANVFVQVTNFVFYRNQNSTVKAGA